MTSSSSATLNSSLIRRGILILLLLNFSEPVTSHAAPPFPGYTFSHQFPPPSGGGDGRYGSAIAISDDYIAISAPSKNAPLLAAGVIEIFDRDTETLLRTITADLPETSSEFGASLAIVGDRLIAGSPAKDLGGTDQGSVYIFDITDGSELHELTAGPDAENFAYFGRDVSAEGNFILVGAPRENGTFNNEGFAYLFNLSTGTRIFRFESPNGNDPGGFGEAVAISGNLGFVGAHQEDGGPSLETDLGGAVHVFNLTTGAVVRTMTLNLDGLASFGRSIDVEGDRVLIGAHIEESAEENYSGAAYLFDVATGNFIRKFVSSSPIEDETTGGHVALSENFVITSSSNGFNNSGTFRYPVRVFDVNTGIEIFCIENPETDPVAEIWATALALDESTAFIGGLFFNSGIGTAWRFELPHDRPDNRVGKQPFSLRGNNIYNLSGAGQTQNLVSKRLKKVRGFFTVENDGNRQDTYSISGSRGNRNFKVKYFQHSSPPVTNVTAAVRAGIFDEADVDPMENGRIIRSDIKPIRKRLRKRTSRGIKIRKKRYSVRLTSSSDTNTALRDVAILRARTK